jgi:heptosyltransferase I
MNKTLTKNISVKTICILRLSAIGDVLMALPAIFAIQKKHPKAQITWIISKAESTILKNIPNINFIVFDKKQMRKELFRLNKELKNIKFDVLLHMQPTLRANLISLVIRAKIKLGFDKLRAKEAQSLFINEQIPALNNAHFVDGFMQFAKQLDNQAQVEFPNLVSDEDRQFAKKTIIKNTAQKTLIMNTCSSQSFPYRNWHKDNFVELVNALPQQISVILIGGNSKFEQETNQYIENKTQNKAQAKILNLTGKTTLTQLVALIEHADGLLSVDSAPIHIADVTKTPVIGLYGVTDPKQTGSYLYPQHCISYYPTDLKWGKRLKSYVYINKISVAEVLNKVVVLI